MTMVTENQIQQQKPELTLGSNYNNQPIFLVYALVSESDQDTVRYVGVTQTDFSIRYKNHISASRHMKRPKDRWIQQTISTSDMVVWKWLEAGIPNEDLAFEREKYYIEYYRSLNHPLTNICDGGPGTTGLKHTEETKRKQSEANKGKQFRKGKTLTEEQKKRIGEGVRKAWVEKKRKEKEGA